MQPSGAAALLEAAETGSVDEAMRLLDEGVSAFSVDMAGYTALHKCAFMGFTHLASSLIRREPRLIDACDITQNTPLHVAAWTGHVRTASTLLDARANVSASDLAGNTPLHRAVGRDTTLEDEPAGRCALKRSSGALHRIRSATSPMQRQRTREQLVAGMGERGQIGEGGTRRI